MRDIAGIVVASVIGLGFLLVIGVVMAADASKQK